LLFTPSDFKVKENTAFKLRRQGDGYVVFLSSFLLFNYNKNTPQILFTKQTEFALQNWTC